MQTRLFCYSFLPGVTEVEDMLDDCLRRIQGQKVTGVFYDRHLRSWNCSVVGLALVGAMERFGAATVTSVATSARVISARVIFSPLFV